MSINNDTTERPKSFIDLADCWLGEAAISQATRRAYRIEVDRFIRWAKMVGATPSTINAELFEKYGCSLSSTNAEELFALGVSKPLLASSLGQARRIVGAWLRWAAARGWVSPVLAVPIQWPKITRKASASTPVQAKRLSEAVGNPKGECRIGLVRLRERFVAGLAFWLCLNPNEIAALSRYDVRVIDNGLAIRVPNGVSAEEWVSAPDTLLRTWLAYTKVRGASKAAVTSILSANPVSAVTIARIIRHIKLPSAKRKESRQLSARDLKRSFVQHAVSCGWTSDDLKRHLRRQAIRDAKVPRFNQEQWRQKLAALDMDLS